MFNRTLIIILASMTLLLTPLSFAKEAKRYDKSVTWKEVVKINFKAGKRSDALKIINEHFKTASVKAKTPSPQLMLEMTTGDYDLLVIWHMEDGIKDMTWETSPDNIAWRTAFNELSGGEDEAKKILDEYQSYIESAEYDIAMIKQ